MFYNLKTLTAATYTHAILIAEMRNSEKLMCPKLATTRIHGGGIIGRAIFSIGIQNHSHLSGATTRTGVISPTQIAQYLLC